MGVIDGYNVKSIRLRQYYNNSKTYVKWNERAQNVVGPIQKTPLKKQCLRRTVYVQIII